MRHQLQAGPAFGPGLMLSAQETFTAGGYIGVADTEANAPGSTRTAPGSRTASSTC